MVPGSNFSLVPIQQIDRQSAGGAFGGAHAVSMLYSALADWDREWGHVMPYGDVTALFAFAIILFVLKRRFLFKQE